MNRSGLSATIFAAACLGGCAGQPAPIERRIGVHSLFGCKVDDGGTLIVTPLGDFGGSPAASVEAKSRRPLDLPQDFLGIELKVPSKWWGIGYAEPPADVDITLWPMARGCNATGAIVPPNRGGLAMTSFADGTGVLVAGLEPTGDKGDSAYALALDLTTGETWPDVHGMSDGRAFATATPFGAGALVAGGVDPSDETDPMGQRAVTTAFVLASGHFEPERIELGNRARAHHGATTLVNGETLLVGGTNQGVVLSSLVAIDPAMRNTRVFGLGTLEQPRKDPIVVRLANNQVLVGGGTDQAGNPVATLEWFTADGSSCAPPACPEASSALPPRPALALVALPAGGALAAGATPSADAFDVWWITPEGTVEPLAPLPGRKDARVRLVSASDGAPWAWNGTTWLRFDPWQARFLPVNDAPDGPEDDMPAPVEVDPGLFVWLARDPVSQYASVRGFRHGLRGRLSRETVPLLFVDAEHVVPDRPSRPGVVSFDDDGLHLKKPFTLPAPRVAITDTLYGDFDLTAEWDPKGALPDVELGSLIVGSGFCPWPPGPTGGSWSMVRRKRTLAIKVGTAETTCEGPEGRVAIAFLAPQFGDALVRKVTISR